MLKLFTLLGAPRRPGVVCLIGAHHVTVVQAPPPAFTAHGE
jgi:hypothetical protein